MKLAKRKIALVPARRDGNLTLIRFGATPEVRGQVATAVSARTIALDSSDGRAYLPSATLAPPVGNGCPTRVPGSLRILVLSPSP